MDVDDFLNGDFMNEDDEEEAGEVNISISSAFNYALMVCRLPKGLIPMMPKRTTQMFMLTLHL